MCMFGFFMWLSYASAFLDCSLRAGPLTCDGAGLAAVESRGTLTLTGNNSADNRLPWLVPTTRATAVAVLDIRARSPSNSHGPPGLPLAHQNRVATCRGSELRDHVTNRVIDRVQPLHCQQVTAEVLLRFCRSQQSSRTGTTIGHRACSERL